MELDTRLLERIIHGLPNYIWVKDKELVYRLANRNFITSTGVSPIGKTDCELPWTPNLAKLYQEEDRYVLSTGQSVLNKEISIFLSGEEQNILINKVPLYDNKCSTIIGVLGTYMDITEKKQADKKMIQVKKAAEVANKAKTEFLKNMRHDIRTPVSGIVELTELLQKTIQDPATKELVDILAESGNALLDFMNEILEIIFITTGDLPLLQKRFSLKEKLENVIQLNLAKATKKRVNLSLEYDEKLPTYFVGDPTRVQRIALELVTNALKFTPEGWVKMTACKAGEKENKIIVKLTIKDTGIGISKDKQGEIYTRFKRLTPSYQGIYKGMGLGLSVTKELIDELKGELSVESHPPTPGTTFTCLLPLNTTLLDTGN